MCDGLSSLFLVLNVSSRADLPCHTMMSCKELVQLTWDPIYLLRWPTFWVSICCEFLKEDSWQVLQKGSTSREGGVFCICMGDKHLVFPYYFCTGCKAFTSGIDFYFFAALSVLISVVDSYLTGEAN